MIPWLDKLRSSGLAISTAIALATVAALSPLLSANFIKYDDRDYVTDNVHVQQGLTSAGVLWAFTSGEAYNWHPLTWLSHMLDVELFGLRAHWHHLTNLLFHVANAVLLFLLLRGLTGFLWRSAVVGLLFAVHPLHVESVAWVAERKDVLSTFFFLLTLMAYARYTRRGGFVLQGPGRSWYTWALVCLAAGLMSKPMLVTTPFVLLLLDLWPLNRLESSRYRNEDEAAGGIAPGAQVSGLPAPAGDTLQIPAEASRPIPQSRLGRLLLEKAPFFALAFASSLVTYLVQAGGHAVATSLPLVVRLANAVMSYNLYLFKAVWPVDLTVFYPHPATNNPAFPWPWWQVLGGLVVLMGLSVLAIWRRKSAGWMTTGWFWYLGTLVPVIGIVQVGSQGIADRYTYIPLIGIFVVVVWGIAGLAARARVMPGILAVTTIAVTTTLASLTYRQAGYWKDNFTLFSHALAVTQRNTVALTYVGAGYGERGDYDRAVDYFERALRIDPGFADAHYALGYTYELQNQPLKAVREYRSALRLRPWMEWVYVRLGDVLWSLGDRDEAAASFRAALHFRPAYPEAHLKLAGALAELGSFQEAEQHYFEVLRFDPRNVQAMRAFAELVFRQNKLPQAELLYRQLVVLEPNSAEVRINLGGVLWREGKREQAFEQYVQAVKSQPAHALAQLNLANALLAQNRFSEATNHYGAARRLRPDLADAAAGLGRALAAQGQWEEAGSYLAEAARLAPTNATYQLNLANACLMSAQTNEAAAAFAAAARLEPALAGRVLEAARALAAQGRHQDALANFELALHLAEASGDHALAEAAANGLSASRPGNR